MSSSKEMFTEAELQQASPWQLPEMTPQDSFAEALEQDLSPDPSQEEAPPESPPVLTAEELEAMQRQAFEEAAKEGREAGYREGYDKGNQEGYKEGYDKGFQQGYREGRDKGEAEGRAAAEKSLVQEAEYLGRIMAALTEPLKQLDQQVEEELVALAIAVARQLIRRELKTDPGQIVAVVREALGLLPLSQRTATVTMHPEDAALVRSALKLDQIHVPWQIVEDPLISRGGCRVETEVSRIDATVEARLAAVIAATFGGERHTDQTGEDT
ncbi:MAG TPA: flagellar assembly protein FliH [Methylothermaceae bacterium]|nr:flagellar assembly protein FliH [Methylothermaceae bacterium]